MVEHVIQYLFLSEILRWRAQTTPDHILFSVVAAKVHLSFVFRFIFVRVLWHRSFALRLLIAATSCDGDL